MAEYIERMTAIRTVCEGCNKDFANEPCEPPDCSIQQGLFAIPTADVVEVRHGEWGKKPWMDTYQHWCPLCLATVRVSPQSVEYKYCPYCGAKMDGGKND